MHREPHLAPLINPASIAVVGASRHPDKAGHQIVANLLASGYKGKIMPVNPAGGEILGLPVAKSVADLAQAPEMAVICLPRDKVLESARQLADKHVRALVVVSSGFKETGREGWYIEEELARFARDKRILLLGPNSLGLLNTHNGMHACLDTDMPRSGKVAFFSQSGSMAWGLLDWAESMDVGFSTVVHLGNKAVLTESDLLEHLAADPETSVIVGSLESLTSGQEFMRVAEATTASKPVLMLKSGNSPAGARAVSSHTGTLPGSRQASRASLKQAGVIQVDEAKTLFTLAQAFARQPLPKGPNLAVVTNSGGPGILAADACERSAMELVRPSQATIDTLTELLPPYAALYNPIDIIGDADAERYRVTMEAVAKDDRIHAMLVILSPTASVEIEETARAVAEVFAKGDKPVFACFMGGLRIEPGKKLLIEAGIPCYGFPEPAIKALETMLEYKRWQDRPYPVEVCFRRDKGRAEKVLSQARELGITEIIDMKAFELGRAYELPQPETELARTSTQAAKIAKRMGVPVALKLTSPQLRYRSRLDGVALNLKTPQETAHAFRRLTNQAARRMHGLYITGCLVQAMVPPSLHALTVGLSRDMQYGPLIRFGFHGPHAEAMQDYAYRLAPLTVGDAQEMIREIRAYPLLRGVRGQGAVDLGTVEDILLTISQMATDFPLIQEAEFGPILVGDQGAFVTDLRLTVSHG